jgi:hypothetical protein
VAMSINIYKALDKEYQNKSLKEILDAPISAFAGISEDGQKVLERFHIKTIGDLANWKFAVFARAIQDLSKAEL